VTDIDRRDTVSDHTVTAFVQAYSPRSKRCSIDYGDDSDTDVFDDLTNPIFNLEQTHEYPGLGFYPMSLTCENSFGRSSETAVAVAAQPSLLLQQVHPPPVQLLLLPWRWQLSLDCATTTTPRTLTS